MKPERDALRCAVSDCFEEPTHATPSGPLCDEHAAEFAELEGAGEL